MIECTYLHRTLAHTALFMTRWWTDVTLYTRAYTHANTGQPPHCMHVLYCCSHRKHH